MSNQPTNLKEAIEELVRTTPYNEKELLNFVKVTALDYSTLTTTVNRLYRAGFPSLKTVTELCILGFCEFEKDKKDASTT